MQSFARFVRPTRGTHCSVQCQSLPGSHPSRRRYGSTLKPQAPKLLWSELYYASTLARWSGLCYKPQDKLPELVKAEGLDLIAYGHTKYTSWWVADGQVDYNHFLDSYAHPPRRNHTGSAPDQRHNSSSSNHSSSSSHNHHPLHKQDQSNHSSHVSSQHPTLINSSNSSSSNSMAVDMSLPIFMPSERRRYVFIRGVHWAAPEADHRALSGALWRFWPAPLAPTLTTPQGALVAHSGVAGLAMDLYDQLRDYLTPAVGPASNLPTSLTPSSTSQTHSDTPSSSPATPLPLSFAGHSLGGALGSLVLALSALHGLRPPSQLSLHTFGSPPVLSHTDGGGGHRVLQVLGLPDSAVNSYVLEHDPVPRALITADPAFHALKQYGPVQQLLQVRGWLHAATGLASGLLGGGNTEIGGTAMITKDRFMFENVGNVYLLRAGSDVVPVGTAADAEELLRMAIADVLAQPARALQAWMDHHHSSYSHDLEAAALVELRRQLRAAAKARAAAQATANN